MLLKLENRAEPERASRPDKAGVPAGKPEQNKKPDCQ